MRKSIRKLMILVLSICMAFQISKPCQAKGITKTVICGDSRVVGLAAADGVRLKNSNTEADGYSRNGKIYYKAKVGKGYSWISDNLDAIAGHCDKNTTVYVALGVNDLGNIRKYKKLYKKLSRKLNGAEIRIAEVGAVNEKKAKDYGYKIRQSDIDSFNETIRKSQKNYKYVDFWYGDESQQTTDGLHYTTKEYNLTLEKFH